MTRKSPQYHDPFEGEYFESAFDSKEFKIGRKRKLIAVSAVLFFAAFVWPSVGPGCHGGTVWIPLAAGAAAAGWLAGWEEAKESSNDLSGGMLIGRLLSAGFAVPFLAAVPICLGWVLGVMFHVNVSPFFDAIQHNRCVMMET